VRYFKEQKGEAITGVYALKSAPQNNETYTYTEISQTEYESIRSGMLAAQSEGGGAI